MAEFFDYNGNTFELPNLTLEQKEKLEAANKAPSDTRAGIETKYNFVKTMLPEEYLEDVLGGDNVSAIDVQVLQLILADIDAAYNLPLIEAQMKKIATMMEPLKGVTENLEALSVMTNGNREMRRKGFKLVK